MKVETSLSLIKKTGMAHVVNDNHIVITCPHGKIEYWSDTGKYTTREWKNGFTLTGRGIVDVLDLIARSKL